MRSIYWVYILTNFSRTTLYIGVTNNIVRRIYEHKEGLFKGFTKKYSLKYLIYTEETDDVGVAIEREKEIKVWNRAKKERQLRQ